MLEYKQMRSAYNKAIRKAKRESWLSFIDSCTSIADASKLTRILTKPKNPPPGLTLTPTGTPTWRQFHQHDYARIFRANDKKSCLFKKRYFTKHFRTKFSLVGIRKSQVAVRKKSFEDFLRTEF